MLKGVTQEYVVDEASGCLEGHPKCGLSRNHFYMNKFGHSLDGDFMIVRDELEGMYKKALSKVEDRRAALP